VNYIMALSINDQVIGGGAGIGLGGVGAVPFGVPVGGFGGGFGGGGGIEALVLLALLGRDGFGRGGDHCHGGGRDGGGDSVAALSAVIAALNNRNDPENCCAMATAVLSKLGSLEGAIPAIGNELQLALQSAVAALTAQGNANAASLTSQLNALQLGQLVQSQNILTAISNVDTNVDRQGCETRAAVFASEARITALLNAQDLARITAENIKLSNEVVELRSDARHRDAHHATEALRIEIRNNNEATAQQLQFQQQSQRQLVDQESRFNHERLCARFDSLFQQVARATNSNVIVGNTGASTTGAQTANPTNVNAL
jgi:hypothetical protein